MVTQVDFSVYDRDLFRMAFNDQLDVFRESPVLVGVLSALVREAQDLYDAVTASLWARTIDGAQGAQLDVIGRIVGLWPRPTQNGAAIDYFTPDNNALGPDWAAAYVQGAPLAGQIPIGDGLYRIAIRAKIARNHVKYGSAPELQYFAQLAYGVTISVRNVGNGNVELLVPSSTPPSVVAQLTAERSDETADFQYGLPLPATAKITSVVYL